MKVRVDCYAGYRGEQTPRRLYLGTRCVTVVRVLDCWLAPDHRYFKVCGDDGGLYILRHHVVPGFWEMTFFRQEPNGAPAGGAPHEAAAPEGQDGS